MSERFVYLDNASTTPLDPAVFDAMLPFLRERFGNASSVHRAGQLAKAAVERAREHVAALFGADPSEIVFTSGGTESDVWAITSAYAAGHREGRSCIITTVAEHQAVLKTVESLRAEGAMPVILPVRASGAVDPDALEAAVTGDTGLVTIMHVNNETGAISDLDRCASIAHRYGALFHTDAVQSAGKSVLSAKETHFDLASASAHKMHGPKGVGALFIRKGLLLDAMMTGGAQERGRRGGTENVPAIVGFGEAARLAERNRKDDWRRWEALRRALVGALRTRFEGIVINGEDGACQPNFVSISFPSDRFGLDGEALPLRLDLEGIAVSSGSACTSGSVEPSHVMRAIGHDEATSRASIRFSFGRSTVLEDVVEGVEALARSVYG